MKLNPILILTPRFSKIRFDVDLSSSASPQCSHALRICSQHLGTSLASCGAPNRNRNCPSCVSPVHNSICRFKNVNSISMVLKYMCHVYCSLSFKSSVVDSCVARHIIITVNTHNIFLLFYPPLYSLAYIYININTM
jgi:hypothetical protein